MITVPPHVLSEILKPNPSSQFVWLWEITAEQTEAATSVFRVTNFPEVFVWTYPDNDEKYQPLPIGHSSFKQTKDSLLAMDLNVSNVTREVSYYVWQGSGFMGLPARLSLVMKDHPDKAPVLEIDWTVSSAKITNQAVAFRLELPNYWQRTVPLGSYSAGLCQHGWKGPGCGATIDETTFGGPAGCNRSLPRCREIGLIEKSLGHPVEHPRRIRMFPGLARTIL